MLLRDQRAILGPFSLELPAGLTAVVGHGGAGKSTLLRALAGALSAAETRGCWLFRGEPVAAAERWYFSGNKDLQIDEAPGDALLLEQLTRDRPRPDAEQGWEALLQRLSEAPRPCWLLDEPTAGAPESFSRRLTALLQRERLRRCVVLVTHDQSLVRSAADAVCILGGGQIELHEAASLFSRPLTPLASRYVSTGSSWPSIPPMPSLPPHFHWVLPEQLAGMGRPGLQREEEEDLSALCGANVNLLISLTEQPFSPEKLRPFGIEGLHFPIPDMGVPSIAPTARLCRQIEARIKSGDRVAIHCHAGLGRTGLVLGSFLVWQRVDPAEALGRLRAINPYFIQTPEQERFLSRFRDDVG